MARQVRNQGLLTVDLAAVSRAIHTLPWVDAVSVERDWPHGLSVLVVEQVAAARWGQDGLVNAEGVLLRDRPQPLSGGTRRACQDPKAPRPRSRSATWPWSGAWGRPVSTSTALRLDARGAWQLDLANGITVRLGRSQVDERFEKFMSAALGIVQHRAPEISYVDMRYTNGFAIGWRSGASHA